MNPKPFSDSDIRWISDVLESLGDPVRLRILKRLTDEKRGQQVFYRLAMPFVIGFVDCLLNRKKKDVYPDISLIA